MAVNKLPEFAKNGQKNTDNLNQEDGFPVNLKPARQWFNYLFNTLALSVNQIVDEDYIRHNEIVDNLTTDNLNKPLSAKQGKYLQDNKLNRAIKIPDNADLNDYQAQGSYLVDYNITAETIKNSPTKLAFSLQVDITAGCVQRLTTYKDAGTLQYIRSQYTGGWTPWYKTYSELDPQPTVDAIDHLNSSDIKRPLSANQGRLLNVAKFDKSGGILTGEININTGESSPIKTVINKSSAITTNSPTELASIIHALSFGWYQSEWQIGNVRSGSQETAGFGLTLGNSNLRFLVNANGTSNYGTFDSVGNITAPLVIGKLQGRVKTETSALSSDNAFLDKYTSGDSSSFFFDNGGGNKYFTQFSVGVSANLQDGGYFLIGASPLDNKIKAMSGVKDAGGGYRLQKNLTLLDSESDNNLKGSFVWDNHKLGGWARGLVYKAKSDSTTYAGFGAYGNTDTVEKLYMAIGGDNLWSTGNGKGVWIDQYKAFTNCNWEFSGAVSGSFSGTFDGSIQAKDIRNVSPNQIQGVKMGYYFAEYTGIRYGVVSGATYGDFLALNGYSDSSGGKANGLFFDKTYHRLFHFQASMDATNWGLPREIAYTDNQTFTGINTFEHGIRVTGFGLGFKYLVKGASGDNDAGWIGVGADQINAGYLEIATGDDGTEPVYVRQYNSNNTSDETARTSLKNELTLLDANGNTNIPNNLQVGSLKLRTPRYINNVPFDGSQDITVRDSTAFFANGITATSNEYPAWNAKSGVYQKTNNGDSSQVIQFLGSGSTPAVQLMARYANNGLFYRSARDGYGFERDFERIVTEGGGVAQFATYLQNPRKINGVDFNGGSDINISAPMRYLGMVDGNSINNAVNDGFYLVASDSIAGLYGYGVLEVRVQGSTIHQTYYAHNVNSNGSVAVRQSWSGNQYFTSWRSLDSQVELGIGQSYRNVRGSRSKNTNYTNSTPRSITVYIAVNCNDGDGGVTLNVNGEAVARWRPDYGTRGASSLSAIVPPYGYYSLSGGGGGIEIWEELS